MPIRVMDDAGSCCRAWPFLADFVVWRVQSAVQGFRIAMLPWVSQFLRIVLHAFG